ncbi:hypothetical protein BO82DRAFT_355379 [Aspergillus uvarum CBS 121591]|uniref:AB hydrolase-1 domain-containing protein n=1 Tax=Aspergillus uvarum CBS 121591 TaxID=1448315 RepID=A0A319CAN9_9EURO|nr:hypothetical protein BO82DRAFT_355379 [Aspergillus uvarum CBS 121591]PYH80657.1 hypothetical protein BO82DRAFT_355379 [Aspergillus uvarum CBS 121591]
MPPTIAFLPGAWLTPTFYTPFLHTLTTTTALPTTHIPYPSLDPDNPGTADCHTDTAAIRAHLQTLIESEGREVILVMHSYAGMPGAAAAHGLSQSARQRAGQPGGVVGMIFLAAFLVPEGVSCAGLQGGRLPGWILLDTPAPQLNYPDDPIGNFLPEGEGEGDDEAALSGGDLETFLRPHATRAFTSPQPAPAWAEADAGFLAFIVTAADRAIPREAQYAMMAATGREFAVREMECGHCAPFIGAHRIGETVRLVGELVRAFLSGSSLAVP